MDKIDQILPDRGAGNRTYTIRSNNDGFEISTETSAQEYQ